MAKWPGKDKDGNRQWLSDEEFKRRGEQMRNEYAAIAALSFYNSLIRENPQLRRACSYRYSLNNTIDAWKMEYVPIGDPPRNAAQSNIIHQLHRLVGSNKGIIYRRSCLETRLHWGRKTYVI